MGMPGSGSSRPSTRAKGRAARRPALAYLAAAAAGSCISAWLFLFSAAPISDDSVGLITHSQQLRSSQHDRSEQTAAAAGSQGGAAIAGEGRAMDAGPADSDEQGEGEGGSVGELMETAEEAGQREEAQEGAEGYSEEGTTGVIRPEVTSVQPYSAAATGGAVITVTGFSLWRRDAKEVTVTVGRSPCLSLLRISSGSLQCVIPGGVGRGLDVAVTATYSVGGEELSATSHANTVFSYHDPSLLSIEPGQGRSSGGTHVTISGANFGPSSLDDAPLVWFGGVECLRSERMSDSAITCITPSHAQGRTTVSVGVGPRDGPVMAAQELSFVYVTTPAERMLQTATAMFHGMDPRFRLRQPQEPLTLHRGLVHGFPYEVQYIDIVSNRSMAFLVQPQLRSLLPDKDYSNHFKTCAVVGDSASLIGSSLGRQIDSRNAVIRLAHSPLKDCETDVGKKTTLRVAGADFLMTALAASGPGTVHSGASQFRKQQATTRAPVFLWDQEAHDLAALCIQAGCVPEVLLAAPRLSGAALSLYQEVEQRFRGLGGAETAQEAARAATDEATPEQAAALLAVLDGPPPDMGETAEEVGEAEGEEPEAEAEQLDNEQDSAEDEEGGTEGDDPDDQEEESVDRSRWHSMRRSTLRTAPASATGTTRRSPTKPSKEQSSQTGRMALDSSPIPSWKHQSLEFGAVMLALQLCEHVDVYGVPSLSVPQLGGPGGGDAGKGQRTHSGLSDLHSYRSDGLYYADAPEEVLLTALTASGALGQASLLGGAADEDSAAAQGGELQPADGAAPAAATRLKDVQVARVVGQHRTARLLQLEFEPVLWRMMALRNYIQLHSV